LATDGRWYRFRKIRAAWELVGHGDADPARLMDTGDPEV
jgi:hypothetical protein